MELPGYGLGEVRAFGQVSYRISEPEVFFRQMAGITGVLTDGGLLVYLRGLVMSQFSRALTNSHPTVEQLMGGLDTLDDSLHADINAKLKPLGFELTQFLIESLSLPPKLRDEIFEYSRLNKLDLGKFTQLQAAKAITQLAGGDAATGGMGAQGMLLGVGLAAAGQVLKSLNAAFASPPDGPPPLLGGATPAFHVALDGKAQGPFTLAQVSELIGNGTIIPETLVWRAGMTGWEPIGANVELKPLFPVQPPPLP